MLSPCYSDMEPDHFHSLPSSTNAVESYNRFSKGDHPEPLKLAMFRTYKEDMAKTLEVMARQKGVSTTFEGTTASATGQRSKQQSEARRKRRRMVYVDDDDADGPPDTKKKFQGETPKKRKGNSTSRKLKDLTNFQSNKGKKNRV